MTSKCILGVLAGLTLTCQAAYGEIRHRIPDLASFLPPTQAEMPLATLSAQGLIAREASHAYAAASWTAYIMAGRHVTKESLVRRGIPAEGLERELSKIEASVLPGRAKK